MKEIIRRCIGNPNIASVIARYPTIPDDIVTYVHIYNVHMHGKLLTRMHLLTGKCFMVLDGWKTHVFFTHGSYIRWMCVCEGLRALSFRRSSKIGTHIIIFLQGCDTDSFTFSLVFYSFTCQFVYLLFIQEGITGVCASTIWIRGICYG